MTSFRDFYNWLASLFARNNSEEETVEDSPVSESTQDNNSSPASTQETSRKTEQYDTSTIEGQAKALRIYLSTGGLAEMKTVKNIRDWVRANLKYKFYYDRRSTAVIWQTKQGDCTDFSSLILAMSAAVGISGFRKAHGYVYVNGEKVMHDWLIFQNAVIDATGPYDQYSYVGSEFW